MKARPDSPPCFFEHESHMCHVLPRFVRPVEAPESVVFLNSLPQLAALHVL